MPPSLSLQVPEGPPPTYSSQGTPVTAYALDFNFDDNSFRELWTEALERYEATTKKDIRDASLFKPSSADELIKMMDSGQMNFEKIRWPTEQRKRLSDVLKGSMRSIEILTNLVGRGIGQAFPPSDIIFAAVSHLIKTAGKVSTEYDNIIRFFTDIKSFLDRLKVHDSTGSPPPLRKIFVEILVSVLVLCALTTKAYKEKRTMKYWKALVKGDDDELAEAYVELQRLIDLEGRMVGAQTMKISGQTLAMSTQGVAVGKHTLVEVKKVSNQLDEITGMLQAGRSKEPTDAELLRLCRDFLQPGEGVKDDYEGVRRTWLEGTATWILEDKTFQDWIDCNGSTLLWISGSPGAGKSHLSGFIVRHLRDKYPQKAQDPSRVSVVYFFCKENDKHAYKRSLKEALFTMAYQVAENDNIFTQHVVSVSRISPDLKMASIHVVWKELFADFFNPQKNKSFVYMIIDGLDEALMEERNDFLDLLGDIEKFDLNMHIAMVGRPELSLDLKEYIPIDFASIKMNASRNSGDISRYIAYKLLKSRVLSRGSQELKAEVVEALSKNANGMFLWVDLMFKELNHKIRPEQVRMALKNLPTGLPQLYGQIFTRLNQNLHPEEIEAVNDIIKWVVCAEEPLTYEQLQGAIKLNTGEELFVLEVELDKCGSIFTVIGKDGKVLDDAFLEEQRMAMASNPPDSRRHDADEDDGYNADGFSDISDDDEPNDEQYNQGSGVEFTGSTIRLRHASLGDYLRSPASKEYFSVNTAELHITLMCFKLFVDQSETDSPLLPYCADYWHRHLARVTLDKASHEEKLTLFNYVYKMLNDNGTLMKWVGVGAGHRAVELAEEPYASYMLSLLAFGQKAEEISEGGRSWAQSVIENYPSILEPVARTYGNKWIHKKHEWVPYEMCRQGHKILQKSGSVPEIGDLYEGPPSVSEIYAFANWMSIPKDHVWHQKVGSALREFGHYKAALSEYDASQQLNPTFAFGYSGKALTLDRLEQYTEACEQQAKAFSLWPEEESWGPAFSKFHIASMKLALELRDEACASIKEAHALDPAKYLDDYWYIHWVNKDYQACMDVLQKTGKAGVVKYFLEGDVNNRTFLTLIAECARTTGTYKVLKKFHKWTIRHALHAQKDILLASACRYRLGALYFRIFEVEKARKQFERVLRDFDYELTDIKGGGSDSLDERYSTVRAVVTEDLSMLYYEMAMANFKKTGQVNAEFFTKLKKLTEVDAGGENSDTSTWSVILMLGLIYRALGKIDQMKAALKERVQLGVDLLSDADLENDQRGISVLGKTLLLSGDEEGAEVVFQMNLRTHIQDKESTSTGGTPTEERPTTPKETTISNPLTGDRMTLEDAPTVDSGSTASDESNTTTTKSKPKAQTWRELWRCGHGYVCDGMCNDLIDSVRHICKTCLNVDYCNSCLEKLKKGEQPFNKCSKDHEFLAFDPLRWKHSKYHHVIYRGEEIETQAFLNIIREQWGLKKYIPVTS